MTLGERLAADGRRLVAGRSWQPPSMLALRPLLARVAALPTPATQRYRRVEAPAAPPGAPLPAPEAPPGEPLPAAVQERLRGLVGPAASAMRVHHNTAAEAFARTQNADAVAVGNDVYFRTGRYRPYDRDGLAVIAHEATHVGESAGSAATWRRATGRGTADEEHAARRVERLVAGPGRWPPLGGPGMRVTPPGGPAQPVTGPGRWRSGAAPAVVPLAPGPVPVTAVVPAARPAAAPGTAAPAAPPGGVAGGRHAMTAAAGRDTEPADAPPGVDFEELRRVLYRDMIGQLRIDFERGA
jgi:hypothetical protein